MQQKEETCRTPDCEIKNEMKHQKLSSRVGTPSSPVDEGMPEASAGPSFQGNSSGSGAGMGCSSPSCQAKENKRVNTIFAMRSGRPAGPMDEGSDISSAQSVVKMGGLSTPGDAVRAEKQRKTISNCRVGLPQSPLD